MDHDVSAIYQVFAEIRLLAEKVGRVCTLYEVSDERLDAMEARQREIHDRLVAMETRAKARDETDRREKAAAAKAAREAAAARGKAPEFIQPDAEPMDPKRKKQAIAGAIGTLLLTLAAVVTEKWHEIWAWLRAIGRPP